MNTYFVRHNTGIDIDDATRSRLWKERRIAIHFPYRRWEGKLPPQDESSITPEDYTGSARSGMRKLVELANAGGYVCAQHHPHEEWMLGFVQPGSRIELLKGKWADTGSSPGRTAVLKTLRLSKVKLVDPLQYAVLQVGRPRQGTIRRWPRAGKTIENLVEGRTNEPQLSDLTPAQQELLCSEFLRLAEAASLGVPRLAHLVLPPGRTMKDIDILGVARDGKRLVAQVTFEPMPNASWKIERLQPYRDSQQAHLILFCDCPEPTLQEGVTLFPLRKAYEVFSSSTLGKAWLQGLACGGAYLGERAVAG
jgi:hypothetical protein